MADTSPGFMMYHDRLDKLAKLNGDVFKRIILALNEYSKRGAEPEDLDVTEMVLFEMLRDAMDRDKKKYKARVAAGSKGGQKSGESRSNKSKQTEANQSKPKQTEANANDCEGCSDKPKQTEANEPTINYYQLTPNPYQLSPKTPSGFSSSAKLTEEEAFPPTREMVERYAAEKGWTVDAEDFLRRCEDAGWMDGEGQPIRNWRMWLKGYLLRGAKPSVSARGVDPRLAALEAMRCAK